MLEQFRRRWFFFESGIISQNVTPTGGSEAGGSASYGLSLSAGAGGSESGGSAPWLQSSAVVPSGGSESGGAAVVSTQIAPTGGSEAGGSALVSFGLTLSSSGGSEAGGSETTFSIGPVNTWTHVATGGSEVRGSATVSFSIHHFASGGSEAGGAAANKKTLTWISAGGGSEASGLAPFSFTPPSYFPEGGSEAGGDGAAYSFSGKILPSGGSEAGGTATYLFTTSSEGGSEAGGAATTTFTPYQITGGSEAGGAALVGVGQIPTGGSESGGSAAVSTIFFWNITPTGGSEATGFASIAMSQATPGGGTGPTIPTSTPYHRGPTTRRAVMRAIQRTLVATGQFTADQVFIKRRREDLDMSPPSEPYLTLALGRNRVEQPDFTGGGLYSDSRFEVFEIRVYQRLEFDQVQRSTEWELEPAVGAQRWVLLASNAIHGEEAFDDAGTCLSGQPMRIIDIGDLQPAPQAGWGFVSIQIEILYTAAEVSA